MTEIKFDAKNVSYDKATKVFSMSEKHVRFDTSYSILNPKTGSRMEFKLDHSTGSEWEPTTKYVYTGQDGVTLEVHNDPAITKIRAKAYLDHKLGRD